MLEVLGQEMGAGRWEHEDGKDSTAVVPAPLEYLLCVSHGSRVRHALSLCSSQWMIA